MCPPPQCSGIPLNTLDSRTRTFPAGGQIIFNGWPGESDPGPYPFPLFARIEGAYPGCPPSLCPGDRHVLVRDNATCTLYEGYACTAPASMAARWKCSNGARFNLSSTAMPQRPLGWTSEDAAGLPIWAGLITLHDVFVRRSIDHAIRFTAPSEVAAYAPPASHLIDVDHTADSPWMGARARLRASFDCAKAMATPAARVICRAMKRTGLVLADRGSAWYLTGEASGEWEARLGPTFDQFLSDIKAIKGADIEVVVAPPALGGARRGWRGRWGAAGCRGSAAGSRWMPHCDAPPLPWCLQASASAPLKTAAASGCETQQAGVAAAALQMQQTHLTQRRRQEQRGHRQRPRRSMCNAAQAGLWPPVPLVLHPSAGYDNTTATG